MELYIHIVNPGLTRRQEIREFCIPHLAFKPNRFLKGYMFEFSFEVDIIYGMFSLGKRRSRKSSLDSFDRGHVGWNECKRKRRKTKRTGEGE